MATVERVVQGSEVNGVLSRALDLALITIITFLIGLLCFNHAYFGDELNPFRIAANHQFRFWPTLREIVAYKPRIIWDAMWAFIAVHSMPRWVPMIINTLGMVAIAWLVYFWAVARCHASRVTAWLAVLAVLFCRFGMVLYFDYIAGTVETLSLAIFSAAVVVASTTDGSVSQSRLWPRIVSVLLVVAAVFVYEPFIAAAVALGVVILLEVWTDKYKREQLALPVIHAALLIVLPLLLFYLATRSFSDQPITTGTAGRAVMLSADNLVSFGTYLSNLFLGTNFGHPWLVGALTLGAKYAALIFVISAVAMVLTYVAAVRGVVRSKGASKLSNLKWLIVAVAFVAVASLPGTARQEGRWIFLAFVFFVFAMLGAFRGKGRVALLVVLCALNVVYLARGSELAIVNVYSARIANNFVVMFRDLKPQGTRVLIMGLSDDAWIFGGALPPPQLWHDRTFSRINLGGEYDLVPAYMGKFPRTWHYDFVMIFVGRSPESLPQFSLVLGQSAQWLVNPPTKIGSDSCNVIGSSGNWGAWHLHSQDMLGTNGSLLISPSFDGFIPLPVQDLRYHVLAYMARADGGTSQPMRLQINWQGKNNAFLGASISVVQVGSTSKVYTTYVSPPPGATTGLVYASTQDGATGRIDIEAICLY